MSRALEAAAVGHRITHDGGLAEPIKVTSPAALGAVMAHQSTTANINGILAQQLSGVTNVGPNLVTEGSSEACPDPCGAIPKGSLDTFIGPQRAPAALLSSDLVVPCEHHPDGPIVTGAATVMVDRMPLARRTDQLDCGAFIGEGEPTILVGGPPTSAPVSPRPLLDEGTAAALVGLGGASTNPPLNSQVGQLLSEATRSAPAMSSAVRTSATAGHQIANGNLGAVIPLVSH